jgi:GTP-binding protein
MIQVTRAELAQIAAREDQFPQDGRPQFAFAGRSNVGKSSLINALVNRHRLAYTSSTPGRTQHVIFYTVNDAFYFVDLPGYGYASVKQKMRAHFKTVVEAYLKANPCLKACVLLLDPKRHVGQEELDFLYYLDTIHVQPIVVLTRWDRLSAGERPMLLKQRKEELVDAAPGVVPVSAVSREGLDVLWRLIERRFADGSAK